MRELQRLYKTTCTRVRLVAVSQHGLMLPRSRGPTNTNAAYIERAPVERKYYCKLGCVRGRAWSCRWRVKPPTLAALEGQGNARGRFEGQETSFLTGEKKYYRAAKDNGRPVQ
ncbi:hypothetical protein HPB50_024918 [Hyalomma asiaticum]|uniref:Uncharacterized protein n=1 Tax=Hyalomma asiaticum TaxID=266040 RepID=A0ACB7SV16_HYAAI|nr:hypothetical protein HPB50_024918 [Hyalomma asiaticum]